MNINLISCKTDSIVGNITCKNLFSGKAVYTLKSTGFTNAETGSDMGNEGVFKSGNVLTKNLCKCGALELTVKLGISKIVYIGCIGIDKTGAVYEYLALLE